jgi:hypothetical protein
MLMHTRGILVMTPDSAMVLTGKQALDFSGSVSADDNHGIGGYERVMGPNGQAQYWAPDLAGACRVLLTHYEHGYVAPGERFPRRAETRDPLDRDVRATPHHLAGSPLTTVGDIFSDTANPGPQAALRHPHGDAGGARRRPSAAGAVGRPRRRRHRRGLGRPPRWHPGLRHRARGPRARPPGRGPRRRSGAVDLRDAVPDVVVEGRPCGQRRQRVPAARRARQPVGLRRLAGVDAQASARVRGGDRPGDGQLPRPDRVLRRQPLPRRRVRRLQPAAQRQPRDPRRRGLARLGDRWRAGRSRRVRRRGGPAHPARPPGPGARPGGRARGRRRPCAPAHGARRRHGRGPLGEAR